jgi:Sec-independent protein translocase protein TatA
MPFDLSIEKLALILVVSLLVFGPGKTAEFAREAGKLVAALRRMWADAARDLSLHELWAEEPAAAATVAAPPRACPACGRASAPEDVYCAACGAAIDNACPACGSRNVSEKTECGLCGTTLPAASRPAIPSFAADPTESRASEV